MHYWSRCLAQWLRHHLGHSHSSAWVRVQLCARFQLPAHPGGQQVTPPVCNFQSKFLAACISQVQPDLLVSFGKWTSRWQIPPSNTFFPLPSFLRFFFFFRCMHLKDQLKEREKRRDKEKWLVHLVIHFPQKTTAAGAVLLQSQKPAASSSYLVRLHGQEHLAIPCCLPRHTSREMAWKWSNQGLHWHPHRQHLLPTKSLVKSFWYFL